MPENLSNRPLHILLVASSEKYRQPIAEVLAKKQDVSELAFVDKLSDLETFSSNNWLIVIISASEFEDAGLELLENQDSVSIIIIYENDEEERALSLTDHRIIDIITVRAIHRLPIILERERRLRQAGTTQLQQTESRFKAVIEGFGDPIVILDRFGIVRYTNDALHRIFGYHFTAILGQPFSRYVNESEREHTRQLSSEPEEREQFVLRLTHQFQLYNGKWTVVETTSHSMVGPDGVRFFVLHMRDVTDWERCKDDLHIIESRYQAIVEDQTDLICRYTPDFRLTFVNSAYSQQYGKTADELIGTQLFDIIPEVEWDTARAHVQSLTRDNPIAISEHHSVMPDGTMRWQQWIDRAFFGTNDGVIEYQGVGRDIHDAKETQDQLNFLYALILGTSTADNLNDALADSMRLICEAQDWEYGEVWIPDHNQQVLKIGLPCFVHPAKTEQLKAFLHATRTYEFAFNSYIPGQVLSSQTSLWTVDVQKLSKSEFLRLDYARDAGIRGIVAIPIMDKEQVLAVMVFMALRQLDCNEVLLELLTTALQQISPIIRRQQMFDELIISEEKYRTLVDNFEGVITIKDGEGNYLFANEKGWEPFDLLPQDRVGKSVYDLFSPEVGDLLVDRAREVIKTGNPRVDIECMQTGSDYRWFRSTIAPLRDPDGAITRVQTISLDITDTKQAEAQLRQAQEIAHLGSWTLNLQTNEIFWSDEFFRICGLEPGSVQETVELGFSIVHPDDRERAQTAFARSRQTGEPYNIEKRIVWPDGEIRWVVSQGQVIFNDDNQPLMLIGTFLDITERKQAELALKYTLHRLKALHTLDQSILGADTLEETASFAVQSISQIMPTNRVSITLINEQQKQAQILATQTQAQITDLPTGTVLPILDSELESLNQQRYIVIKDLAHYGSKAANSFYEEGVRSILSIGLKQEGNLIGALNLYSTSDTFFEGDNLQMPLEIADQIAVAIYTMMLNEQIHKQNEELEVRISQRTADLERLKTRTEAILASSADGIVLLNEDLQIEQANPALAALLACDSDSLWNSSAIKFIHVEDRDRFIQLIDHASTNKSPNLAEVRLIRETGEIRYADISIVQISSSVLDSAHFVCSIHDITRRKRANDELRQSEARYRALFEQSTDGIFILDFEGNHLYANPQAVSMFGYSLEEIVGLSFRDLVHSSEHKRSVSVLRRLLDGEDVAIYERQMQRRDGTVFPVEINVQLVRDEKGRPLHIQSLMRDIGERKRSEIALRESEAKYRSLIETMHSGFVIYDLDERFVYVNDQMCEMMGYRADELIGTLSTDYLDTHSKQKVIAQLKHRREGQLGQYEITAKRGDGQLINLLVSASPMLDSSGNYKGSSAVIANITPLKQAQAMQEKLAQWLRLATEVGGIGVWVLDLANDGLVWDQQMYHLYGVPPEEFSGMVSDFESALHPDDYAYVMDALNAAIRGEREYMPDFRIIIPDGRVRHVRARAMVLRDEAGNPERMIGTNMDITDERLAAESLQRALAQERELGELKSRFVSMASHEFRTPLATISATTETLLAYRDHLDGEKLDARLHKILYQVDHMKDIMEDVLKLASIQAGRVELKPLLDDLDALCREIIEEFREQPEYSGRIIYQCALSPLQHVYDPGLMRYVITNLISNALKYSPPDQSVLVDLDMDVTTITLKVHDKGIGIPQSDVKRLFEPFHRARNVGTVSGTGLGLSITKEAVELHGGSIQIETEVNAGTVFTVILQNIRR